MPVLPFESEGQREAYERLRAPLEALFPGLRERIHAIGYVYEVDGTIVTTTLAPWGDDTIVANRCYLAVVGWSSRVPRSASAVRGLARSARSSARSRRVMPCGASGGSPHRGWLKRASVI